MGGEGIHNPADLTELEEAVAAIPLTPMRGTDNAALAAIWTPALATALANYTAARAAYLDELAAANLPSDIDDLLELAGRIDDATQHVTSIFPDDTDATCTFTTPATAHLWSDWTEIVDSPDGNKLSDAFADAPGHITSIVIETVSDNAALYMYEIAWGDANLITSGRFAGSGKFQAAHIQDRFWAPPFPAGELIYYRMKTDQAVADTCTIHFRYHAH